MPIAGGSSSGLTVARVQQAQQLAVANGQAVNPIGQPGTPVPQVVNKVAPAPSGVGQPGSTYSVGMANSQGGASSDGVRKSDNGDGTYTWQQLNSVTGRWESVGR